MTNKPKNTHPVQTIDGKGGRIQTCVTMRAYEVYSKIYAPQEALITGDCRGGFATNELIAFLYARTFPKEEWREREKEAFRDMEHI